MRMRHILLGGLIAAGMGSLSMAVVTAWLDLPSQAIPAGGAAGSGRLSRRRLRTRLHRGRARPPAQRQGGRPRCVNFSASRAPSAATPPSPAQAFGHRLRVGVPVAVLILIVSSLFG